MRIKALLIATYASSFLFLFRLIIKISLRLWLIKCCKIQRNNYFGLTNYLYIQRNNYFDLTNYLCIQRNNYLYIRQNSYLCIQRNNYFDSTNYLYIQRNNYLHIQRNNNFDSTK